MLSKQALRDKLLSQRQSLSAGEIDLRSNKIYKNFLENHQTLLPQDYATAALYFPIRGEVDTRLFFQFFKARQKICLLPKVESSELAFYPVRDWSELQLGKFGIGEPKPRTEEVSSVPDVVLVPGVAFSLSGHRLGYGAGFYDRAIKKWGLQAPQRTMRFLGLAYEMQIVQELPFEEHDRQVDCVITEDRIFTGRRL
ncbi:MAG: 5-formyltetrahydrofolate cyclo-ligase [Bdellovibrionota bacterium]